MSDSILSGPASLADDVNKIRKGDQVPEVQEGVVSDKVPELKLEMKDTELLSLTRKWESGWKDSSVRSEWHEIGKDNEKYWLGKHFDSVGHGHGDHHHSKNRSMVDNVIFESLETFLPQASRRNPEPFVSLHSSEKEEDGTIAPDQEKYIKKVKERLVDLADENVLRLKLKKVTRHWAIYLLGALEHGWDLDKDIPFSQVIRPQRLILDPEATIDEKGYSGNFVGVHDRMEAQQLIDIVNKNKENDDSAKGSVEAIQKALKKDEKGTQIGFIRWWTPTETFWTLSNKHVLLKKKMPHWNYDEEVEKQVETDEQGVETPTEDKEMVRGVNHLSVPTMPFDFLTVYNLGDKPVDNTSLISQNLANQDVINKRNKQIDKNARNINGGWVISSGRSGLNKSQATEFVRAMQSGGAATIPEGAPQDAIFKFNGQSLPNEVFNDLNDKRNRLRDIFGTSGSTPAGVKAEDTVRGKFLNRGLDTDRIGGGVSEYLEQLADRTFNYWIQLLYVYDEDFQFQGKNVPPKINGSVKEGSLLPKDSASIAAQAIELANAGKLSTLDLYKRLEYPNAEELAVNAWLETNAPQILYKDNPLVQEALAGQQQAPPVAPEDVGAEEQPPEQEPINEQAPLPQV